MKLIKFKQDTLAYIIALAITLAVTAATIILISSVGRSNAEKAISRTETATNDISELASEVSENTTEETERCTLLEAITEPETTETEAYTPTEIDIYEESTTEYETESETDVAIEVEPTYDSVDISYSPFDVELLACVIYQEAGGDYVDDNFRRMVGDVVLNRVNDPRFANTIYGVLITPGQYGWDCYSGVTWPARAYTAYEQHAVARAYRIAEELLNGYHSDIYGQGYVWQAEFVQGDYYFQYYNTYFGR